MSAAASWPRSEDSMSRAKNPDKKAAIDTTLVAVTRLNLNGVELMPDDELPADQVETLDEAAIAQLLEDGVIRRA